MSIWSAEIKELEKLHESFKGKLPELEKELERLVKAEDENMILLYSRRCLEVIITDLCECELKRHRKTEPLKGIIDKLHKEEKVPSHIITSMHGLNELSTYGAHPKDFDPKQVRTTLINLETIIEWYLKHEESGAEVVAWSAEEIGQEVKSIEDEKKKIPIPGKRLISTIIGSILLILIVVSVLFYTDIIGGGKKIQEIEKSIAVLPFINDSSDTTNLYFCNGMMDEILTQLQKIGDLKVKSRTSGERYRYPDKDIIDIGRELGVSLIVEGSVRKVNNELRITAQLINAKTGDHLWADTYDGKYTAKIFDFQTDVARKVVASMNAVLTTEEKQRIGKKPTANLAAYDLYLRANNYLNEYEANRDLSFYNTAVNLYKEALEIDSSYAKAYTGLARAYFDRYQWETYFKENYLDSMLVLTDIALDFDNQLDEALYLKGMYFEFKGDIEEALENYDETLKINPNYYAAYKRKGWVLTSIKNDYVNGIDNYNKALTRISGNERSSLLRDLGFAYKDIGFFEKAKYYYNEAFAQDSDNAANFYHLTILAAVEGKFDEALEIERKQEEMDSSYIPVVIMDYVDRDEAFAIATRIIDYYKKSGELNLQTSHRVGFALWRMRKYKEARYYLDQQIKYSEESIKLKRDIAHWKAAYYDLAITYAFLDNKEKAYQYLDELNTGTTCQIRWIAYLKYDPPLESIRSEERFQKILHNYEAKYQAEHDRVQKWLEETGQL